MRSCKNSLCLQALTSLRISLYLDFLIMVMTAFLPRLKLFMKIPALGMESHQLPTSRTVSTDAFTSCLQTYQTNDTNTGYRELSTYSQHALILTSSLTAGICNRQINHENRYR